MVEYRGDDGPSLQIAAESIDCGRDAPLPVRGQSRQERQEFVAFAARLAGEEALALEAMRRRNGRHRWRHRAAFGVAPVHPPGLRRDVEPAQPFGAPGNLRVERHAAEVDQRAALPDGYDTRIGSSGRELSGGEKQRISIARAILSNPKILILDEATASVDTETERDIQKSISYLIKGRTTISIAHRLSTLKDADYLVVIDNGKITERGTHKELEALKGTYFKLMELQRKALALKGIK